MTTTNPTTSDGHSYDQNYESYVEMIERNNYGTPMTREQWEAAQASED